MSLIARTSLRQACQFHFLSCQDFHFLSCQADHFELASQSSRALCIVHTKSLRKYFFGPSHFGLYSYNRVSCFPNPVTIELDVTTLYPSRSRAFRICERHKNWQYSGRNFLTKQLAIQKLWPARTEERTQRACPRCPRSPAGPTPSPPAASSRGGSTRAQKPTWSNVLTDAVYSEQTLMLFSPRNKEYEYLLREGFNKKKGGKWTLP